MIVPTARYVVIATYGDKYPVIEVFETASSLRAELVFKALVEFWTRDLKAFGVPTQKFWTVVVEEPLYDNPDFAWLVKHDGDGNLIKFTPNASIRRMTQDQDLVRGVD